MTKPFLIVNLIEGKLGKIWERQTWEEALDCAVKVAAEQCDTPEADIRDELENDTDFLLGSAHRLSRNGDIMVHIAQAED